MVDICFECSGLFFYTKDHQHLLGKIPGVHDHSECRLMDERLVINKFGKAWEPKLLVDKKIQPPKYVTSFKLQEDEEVLGITVRNGMTEKEF